MTVFNKIFFIGMLLLALLTSAVAQNTFTIKGKVTCKNTSVKAVDVYVQGTKYRTQTDSLGKFILKEIEFGKRIVVASHIGFTKQKQSIANSSAFEIEVNFSLDSLVKQLDEVVVMQDAEKTFGLTYLKAVEDGAIYAGKKNEVVVMKDVVANTATNNTRQVYSKVAGLNIFENDGAGIQLGIGGRGLNPSRVTNFNTRQNGYEISADALGYPESYYSPPTEAVERIEIVRGAASLQYGTQFGGFINFKLKNSAAEKPFEILSRQTIGSFGLFNSFNSVGGKTKKINYYAFYQRKVGEGWRPNSAFTVNTAYASIYFTPNDKLTIGAEYTHMNYLAQQPGGLTDAAFEKDPQQSIRNRNWFSVNWNLFALKADYALTDRIKINTRFFGLLANRSALGFMGQINRADPLQQRDLWIDDYANIGNETRLLFNYAVRNNPSVLLIGARYYNGTTYRKQGVANSNATGTKSDFSFVNPTDVDYSDYTFNGKNYAVFVENIFQLSSKLSVTPGFRYEYISTAANGYYNLINKDLAGNIIFKAKTDEQRLNERNFPLFGIGVSYKPFKYFETYANISQNYRAINFNDMRVQNPNVVVDLNLKDEAGYTADIGFRGRWKQYFIYDVSAFYLRYNNRIGTILQVDNTTFNIYRYRTNIAASYSAGVESYCELDVWRFIRNDKAKFALTLFSNLTFIDARYIDSKAYAIENNKVEMVPDVIFKTGTTLKYKTFAFTYQYAYNGNQYSDASNAVKTANAVAGIIPAYNVQDLSAQYNYKFITISAGINNLTDERYFTRRADGYPGPGILPSDARSYYVSLQVKF